MDLNVYSISFINQSSPSRVLSMSKNQKDPFTRSKNAGSIITKIAVYF